MANTRRRSFQRVQRRPTDWHRASADFTALGSVVSGAQLVVSTVAITEGSVGPVGTIIRIRGCIHLEIAAETAAQTLQEYGIGIALVDDRALAVSSAAGAGLPQPIDDEDFEDWMWWNCGYLGVYDLALAIPEESNGTGRRLAADLVIDSKAMRKWDENQSLVVLVQNRLIDGAATEIDVVMHARMLLKAP